MELVSQVAVPILVAVITSFVTVRLSVRAFWSQRWWERKADAYSSIINALSQELAEAWRILDAEERRQAGAPDGVPPLLGEAEARTRRREAQLRLHEAASEGAFFISESAAKHLEKLRVALAGIDIPGGGLYEHVDAEYTVLNTCLTGIRECARGDLSVLVPSSLLARLRLTVRG